MIHNYFNQIEAELNVEDDKYRLSKIWDKDPRITPEEWQNIFYERSKKETSHLYIISYSRCCESLPMWRMYGDNGNGVSLGFDVRIYLKNQDGISLIGFTDVDFNEPRSIDVEYGSVTKYSNAYFFIKASYLSYIESVKGKTDENEILDHQLDALSNMLYMAAPFIKHGSYSYEKESRIMSIAKDVNEIKHKTSSSGAVVPYIEIKIPLNYLKEVIIGPCCDYELKKYVIDTRLQQLGINGVDINKSEVPYRC